MAKKKTITDDDLDLLDELGVDTEAPSKGGQSAREQQILAGFDEIVTFFKKHRRPPRQGDEQDIFERLYAVRLESIRHSSECRALLEPLDTYGLLGDASAEAHSAVLLDEPSDAQLLAELGVVEAPATDVAHLVHVRSRDEIKAAEEIARRSPCLDFDDFRPIFEKVQSDLKDGRRLTSKYKDNAEVKKGDLFIMEGQKVIVAEMGEPFVSDYGREDRRLRVVYDNGTESDLLVRSLQRALNRDKLSRRISDQDLGPLFSGELEEADQLSGTVYVLRSKSDHPFVAQNRTILHKIGITGGQVKTRIAGAAKDPTYLLADVEIVAAYKLANIDRKKFESLLHNFFAVARLDLELKDRFGFQVAPQEWFLVPLPIIEEVIQRIVEGTLDGARYDATNAKIISNAASAMTFASKSLKKPTK